MLLTRLEAAGLLQTAKQQTRPVGSATSIAHTAEGQTGYAAERTTGSFCSRLAGADPQCWGTTAISRTGQPVSPWVTKYLSEDTWNIWSGLASQCRRWLADVQFSNAAWADRGARSMDWVDEATRERHLPQVVNNSRFLLAPWVHIKNLASATLARGLRRLPADWQAQYGVTPLLVETSWTRRSIAALVIELPIGWSWERRTDGAAMMVSIAAMERGPSGSSCIR